MFPSFLSAELNAPPAEMAFTSRRFPGALHSPDELSPHATIVPSFFGARPCSPPAEIATYFGVLEIPGLRRVPRGKGEVSILSRTSSDNDFLLFYEMNPEESDRGSSGARNIALAFLVIAPADNCSIVL
jgi:hypothetical protein